MRFNIDHDVFLSEGFQLRDELSDLSKVVSNEHLTTIILDALPEERYSKLKVQSIKDPRQSAGGVGGRGGRGDGGVGQREQWEDPMATQSDREIELSQTNQGVGGVCVGVVRRVQSKLPAPSTHTVGRSSCKISKPKKVRRRRELW